MDEHGESARGGFTQLKIQITETHAYDTSKDVVKAGDALTEGLTKEQKELFEDYMTAQREVSVLTDCETFCMAFKLGAKIMLDVLTEGQMREI